MVHASFCGFTFKILQHVFTTLVHVLLFEFFLVLLISTQPSPLNWTTLVCQSAWEYVPIGWLFCYRSVKNFFFLLLAHFDLPKRGQFLLISFVVNHLQIISIQSSILVFNLIILIVSNWSAASTIPNVIPILLISLYH